MTRFCVRLSLSDLYGVPQDQTMLHKNTDRFQQPTFGVSHLSIYFGTLVV